MAFVQFVKILGLAVGMSASSVTACAGSGDGGPTEPACLAKAASATCAPEYEPTYDNVFAYTLEKTCAAGGCHEGESPKGGLALDRKESARENLLAADARGKHRVVAGDVTCGKVIVRLESEGEPWSMPPGNHLRDAELCAMRQWIANGARP